MASDSVKRKLSAILAADVVGYSRMIGADEEGTLAALKAIREDIIMLRVPAYGSSGPYENARALGVHLESVMGHTLLRGYPEADPTESSARGSTE